MTVKDDKKAGEKKSAPAASAKAEISKLVSETIMDSRFFCVAVSSIARRLQKINFLMNHTTTKFGFNFLNQIKISVQD